MQYKPEDQYNSYSAPPGWEQESVPPTTHPHHLPIPDTFPNPNQRMKNIPKNMKICTVESSEPIVYLNMTGNTGYAHRERVERLLSHYNALSDSSEADDDIDEIPSINEERIVEWNDLNKLKKDVRLLETAKTLIDGEPILSVQDLNQLQDGERKLLTQHIIEQRRNSVLKKMKSILDNSNDSNGSNGSNRSNDSNDSNDSNISNSTNLNSPKKNRKSVKSPKQNTEQFHKVHSDHSKEAAKEQTAILLNEIVRRKKQTQDIQAMNEKLALELEIAQDRAKELNATMSKWERTQKVKTMEMQAKLDTTVLDLEKRQKEQTMEMQAKLVALQKTFDLEKSKWSQMSSDLISQNEAMEKEMMIQKVEYEGQLEALQEAYDAEKGKWHRTKSDLISETDAMLQQMDILRVDHSQDSKALQISYDTLRDQFEREKATWIKTENGLMEEQKRMEKEVKTQTGKTNELVELLEKIQVAYDEVLKKYVNEEGQSQSLTQLKELQLKYHALLLKSGEEQRAQQEVNNHLVIENESISKVMKAAKEEISAQIQREMGLQQKEYQQRIHELALSDKLKTKEIDDLMLRNERLIEDRTRQNQEHEHEVLELQKKIGNQIGNVDRLREENEGLRIQLERTQQEATVLRDESSKLKAVRESLWESERLKSEMQSKVNRLGEEAHLLNERVSSIARIPRELHDSVDTDLRGSNLDVRPKEIQETRTCRPRTGSIPLDMKSQLSLLKSGKSLFKAGKPSRQSMQARIRERIESYDKV